MSSVDPLTLAYHELRAPLGLIATASRAAADDCADESLRKRWETINRVAERMLDTAQQILRLADERDQAAVTERFCPVDVVLRLVADLRALDLPVQMRVIPGARGVTFQGCKGQFEVLAQSLLDNAIDHRASGAPIYVEVGVRGQLLSFVVRNRAAVRSSHRGQGLGLHLCRLVAEKLNGDLTIVRDGDEYEVTFQAALNGLNGK